MLPLALKAGRCGIDVSEVGLGDPGGRGAVFPERRGEENLGNPDDGEIGGDLQAEVIKGGRLPIPHGAVPVHGTLRGMRGDEEDRAEIEVVPDAAGLIIDQPPVPGCAFRNPRGAGKQLAEIGVEDAGPRRFGDFEESLQASGVGTDGGGLGHEPCVARANLLQESVQDVSALDAPALDDLAFPRNGEEGAGVEEKDLFDQVGFDEGAEGIVGIRLAAIGKNDGDHGRL
ncbi:MAG: hypothetical protein A4E73_01148 [Syntrophaceae bacterium PtaU1.Bin231]|nr:MAG: hypothetical protein A4E73_01148 [Syntrophaceae bacterium PtaU1.Bin231]